MRIGGLQIGVSRQLQETSRAIQKSLIRLSTGSRIQSPRDGVADYATIQRLSSGIRGLTQAIQNINLDKGLLETANAGIQQQMEIVQRMRELAVEAASSGLSSTSREAIQKELYQLNQEFNAIALETDFNGIRPLSGDQATQNIILNPESGSNFSWNLPDTKSSSIFKENVGTGSFTLEESYTSGETLREMAIGDFNNDGHMDFVGVSTTTGVQLGFGRGDGEFTYSSITSGVPASALYVTVADIDGDGNLDFATADQNDDAVSIFIGNGDGTFQARITYATPDRADQIKFSDLNNDGILDLVASYGSAANTSAEVSVRLGLGDGTFAGQTTLAGYGTTMGSRDFTIGDFNGDGFEDLIVGAATNSNFNTRHSVYINDGDGTFTLLSTFDVANFRVARFFSADVDDDGALDLLTFASSGLGGTPSRLSVYLGDGVGGFGTAITSTLGSESAVQSAQIGDFNGDGILDAVAGFSVGTHILLGAADGTFSVASTSSVDGDGFGIADLNGDGVNDLMIVSSSTTQFGAYLANSKLQSALDLLSVQTAEDAEKLIRVFDDSIVALARAQAEIGIALSRVDRVMESHLLHSEALEEARSRIADADIALETAALVEAQIRQNAQLAVLAQGQVFAQVVLELLG